MPEKLVNGVPISEILTHYEMDPSFIERIAHRTVPGPAIAIADPDPTWPEYFQIFKTKILSALSPPTTADNSHKNETETENTPTILAINHIGSTSVPGLPAKPVIDIDLVLSHNTRAHEPFYVPRLEAAGFQFLLREPRWHEHRFFAAHAPMSCNLHVFGPACAEVERHRIFRDWLRREAAEREVYAECKRECARVSAERGEDVMEYNLRKQEVVRGILERALRAEGILEETEGNEEREEREERVEK